MLQFRSKTSKLYSLFTINNLKSSQLIRCIHKSLGKTI